MMLLLPHGIIFFLDFFKSLFSKERASILKNILKNSLYYILQCLLVTVIIGCLIFLFLNVDTCFVGRNFLRSNLLIFSLAVSFLITLVRCMNYFVNHTLANKQQFYPLVIIYQIISVFSAGYFLTVGLNLVSL